ncbi:hypothetical protein BRD56_04535 [Thermoplasmatales archaeon SW_10_69_26]|nr:MAG: hypothetical protein BRD56_04535 [Thermoplasmatales archaeon SW_10_69_26]
MRTTLLALTVLALATVGADPALAQDPCEPSCDVDTSETPAASGPTLAPALLAMTALAVVLLRAPSLRRR